MAEEENLYKRKFEETLALLAAERAKNAENDARIAEKDATIAAERAKSERRNKFSEGTYYALIDDVFVGRVTNSSNHPVNKEAYDRVCRSPGQTTQSIISGTTQTQKTCSEVYQITEERGRNDSDTDLTAADGDNQSRSSTHTVNKHLIWKCTVAGSFDFSQCEIAHLVPASVQDANTYWFVTNFLFGGDREQRVSWEERLRLLHGTYKKSSNRRISHTGIKHSVANKIFLGAQKVHFDQYPDVLIIPICDIEFAKSWSGGGYEAIMLIDAPPPKDEDDEATRTYNLGESRKTMLKGVAGGTQLSHVTPFDIDTMDDPDVASHDEIRKAHTLVEMFADAILYALSHKVPTKFDDDKGSGRRPNKRKEKRKQNAAKLKGFAESFRESRHFVTTKLVLSDDMKVRKVKFTAHWDEGGHPAPDPMLLTTRAAIQLQKRRGILLVAAGEADSDDERDELSVQAEEDFLRDRKQNCKDLLDGKIIGSNVVF